MADPRGGELLTSGPPARRRVDLSITLFLVASLMLTGLLSGCSLAVMAGKMLFGDPLTQCEFRTSTGVDLLKSDQRLLILCSVPGWVRQDQPSIEYDIIDGVTRRLKSRGINVVDPGAVGGWLDDHGHWNDPAEIAGALDADYVARIDLDSVTYREPNSRSLFRGRATGNVYVYEIGKIDGRPSGLEKMSHEFMSEYPFAPVDADQTSAAVFEKQYLDRICSQLAMMFYDHRFSEKIQ